MVAKSRSADDENNKANDDNKPLNKLAEMGDGVIKWINKRFVWVSYPSEHNWMGPSVSILRL